MYILEKVIPLMLIPGTNSPWINAPFCHCVCPRCGRQIYGNEKVVFIVLNYSKNSEWNQCYIRYGSLLFVFMSQWLIIYGRRCIVEIYYRKVNPVISHCWSLYVKAIILFHISWWINSGLVILIEISSRPFIILSARLNSSNMAL